MGDRGVLILMLGSSVFCWTSFVITESELLNSSEDDCAFSLYPSPGVASMPSELPELVERDIPQMSQQQS